MTYFKKILWVVGSLFIVVQSAYASTFIVNRIQVVGNQRLTSSAVLSYLPVHIGQKFNTDESAAIISALYKSNHFSDVSLLRRGNTLVVKIKEKPTIGRFVITGNKKIDDKKLKPVLKDLKLQVGDVYSAEKMNEFRQGLVEAYKNMGRYDVVVTDTVKPTPYNTVDVHVVVHEGITTKVHSIHFSGNHAFSDHTLREQFTLTTPGIFTILNHRDLYSPLQLDKDLVSLQNFYFNHGYLEFRVLSKKVEISPDRKHANIYIQIYEGPVYHLSGCKITGKYAANKELKKIISELKVGEVFSRKKIIEIDTQIGNYFSDRGYAFPKINATPDLNRAQRTVFLTFNIETGSRTYVRFVHVAGNSRTTGKALRYQMRQLEGSTYSLKEINESKRRIANLPYFKDIEVTPTPVEGASNQVDLNYHVTEVSAGRASVQGGYSDVDGFIYGASISDPNFMGTGKYASIGFQNSDYAQHYSIGYTNPFYTTSGMSRGFNIYYTHTTPSDVNLDEYTMDTYGLNINYSMPLSEYNYLTFGYGYSHVDIEHVNPLTLSPSAYQFTLLHGTEYNDFTGSVGIIHSSLDRAIFPMSGNYQALSGTLGVPIFDSSLGYYKLDYSGRWYWRLGHRSGFVLHPHLMAGYGDGVGDVKSLPFFLNYYGGGIDTLPGYEPNTLGPQNPNDPGNAVGGNFEVFGGLNLIFPIGIQSIRTSLFVDFGNIFQTHKTAGNPGSPRVGPIRYEDVDFDNLRFSGGLLVSWNSPFGIISVAYGMPFNVKTGDNVQQFGFTFGTSL